LFSCKTKTENALSARLALVLPETGILNYLLKVSLKPVSPGSQSLMLSGEAVLGESMG
jgi:hypothetical protein